MVMDGQLWDIWIQLGDNDSTSSNFKAATQNIDATSDCGRQTACSLLPVPHSVYGWRLAHAETK